MTNNLLVQDHEHRALALDARQSFIVQAPAGSGKTELLIQRFLTLLNHVNAPEEILAITFTKKAANEMRARVIKAIKQALTEPEPESAHAQKTWRLAAQVLVRDKQFNWNIINNPNQLRIQTIDSLCAYLTRQLPLLSHFGSQPDIADNPAMLYREAAQEVLLHVEEDDEWSRAISRLLLHIDNDFNKLHTLLVNLLAKRDQWLPYIPFDMNDNAIKKQLEHHLSLTIIDRLTALHEIFPQTLVKELISLANYAASNLVLANSDSLIRACEGLDKLPGLKAQDKNKWLGLAELLLTVEGNWRKRIDINMGFPPPSGAKNQQEKILFSERKKQLADLLAQLQGHENVRLVLSRLKHLPEPEYPETQWETLQALLNVLKITAAQLRLTFQQYGQIDFIENVQAALAALGHEEHPTDLALALDYQIRHILIDEFQDTSSSQYQLIEKLTTGWEQNDGRTLFVVGDPMQSIYRFREAEVGLFMRMRKYGIGNIKLVPLTLTVNFRSLPEIVEWNNAQFKNIFPSFNDIATGAVLYNPSIAHQHPAGDNTYIEVRGFIDADDHLQARHIIDAIKDARENHADEKIAILVRSRPHLAAIIPALKKAKIPYRAIDIDPLASRQHIQDLISLTCALLHPADRIAWLAVLRAPWCGLTLADLLVIAGNNPYTTLLELIADVKLRQQLSQDGQTRLIKLHHILQAKIAERDRYVLRYWIESTWLQLGGPACLNDYAEMDDVNAYFKLLEKMNQDNQIVNIETLKEKIEKLYASTQDEDTAVQIMTIHTAKGLEFDTVILPHLERKIPNDDKSLLLWMEQPLANDQIALLLAPINASGREGDPIYDYINRQQKIKTNYEIDRLFYVAATRAKKRLYLFFNATKNEKDSFSIASGSFLEKLWAFVENNHHEVFSTSLNVISNTATNAPENTSRTARLTMRLSSNWSNPVQTGRYTNVAYHAAQDGFQLKDNHPRLIGTVLHRVLQNLSQKGISYWSDRTAAEQKQYLEHLLRQSGITENLEAAICLCYKSIENTLNDSRGKWILQSHQEAKAEYAVTAMIDNQIENLIIDRTFVDETGTRWIIDYKTTAFSHRDLEHFLENEQKKYLEKMRMYQRAMRMLDDREIKLGLYFPVLPAWREWV